MLADQMSSTMITPYDLKRLEQYASNMADYHLIMDLVPSLAKLHFLYEVENLNKPNLGAVQQAILAGIGLQCKSVDTLASELDVPASQLLGLMNTMRPSPPRCAGSGLGRVLVRSGVCPNFLRRV